eukprot:6332477-Prymnesium_polylepis.1
MNASGCAEGAVEDPYSGAFGGCDVPSAVVDAPAVAAIVIGAPSAIVALVGVVYLAAMGHRARATISYTAADLAYLAGLVFAEAMFVLIGLVAHGGLSFSLKDLSAPLAATCMLQGFKPWLFLI